jgi:predicted DCC family thiol-disulfide oxidoreductase YuxK
VREDDARRGYTLLYDGECPFCRKSVSRLQARDTDGLVEVIPAQDSAVPSRFPWLSEEALRGSIHLVGPGNRTWEGAGALEELVSVLPRWRWAAWVFSLPFARPLARWVYRWVARNRYRISCNQHCG